MNFTSLRYFLAVAEEENITRAAEKLYLSQQALSGHIARLEKELGVKLFERSPAFSLTYAGRELQKRAEEILSAQRIIYQTARDINNDIQGELRVGITHTCGRALLPEILPAYSESHPKIELQLLEGNASFLEASLQSGRLDLIISYAPIGLEGAEAEQLIDERLLLVVPKEMMRKGFGDSYDDMISRCRTDLDLSLFSRMPFIMLKKGNRIREMIDAEAERRSFRPSVILEVENLETAFALARRGMGITAYPELFRWCIHRSDELKSGAGVEFFPFSDPRTRGALNIAWLRSHYQSRAAREFVDCCKEAMESVKKEQREFDSALLL